jgi:hypothetical protein
MARKRSRNLWILCAALLVLAGCYEQEQIRSYDVKKETFDGDEPNAQRLLAVMVPRPDTVWFFKLMGAEQAVGEQIQTFDRFLETVRFTDHERKPIQWTVPESWRQLPGMVGRYATLRREGKGPALEITVTQLPPGAKDPRNNIDRWRGQLGLGPIGEAELKKLVGNVKVDGVEGTRVDFIGQAPGKKRGKAALGFGRRPFRFTKPEEWEERPPDSPKGIFRAAVFRVREGEHSAEVAVVPLAGDGGGPLANVNRWRMQIGLDPLQRDRLDKDLRKLDIADGVASYVDLLGRGPTGAQRILGAWIAHGGRTWFITMKGPPELVGKQQAAFEAFVKSIRFADGGGAAHE